MRKASLALAILLLPAPGVLAAEFDPKVWQFRRTLRVHEPDRVSVIRIDRDMYERTRSDLGDIRVAREGMEVPYVIETSQGSLEERETESRILSRSVVSGPGLQVTLDLQRNSPHNRLQFVTSERNFRHPVRIEISDDQKFWSVSRDEGYIFDFTGGDRQMQVLWVDFPVTTFRYLRATVTGWNRTDSLAAIKVFFREERPPRRDVMDASIPERTENTSLRETLLKIDLGHAGVPHDSLRIESGPGSFHRPAELEDSADGKEWRVFARGVLYQVPSQVPGELSTTTLTYRPRSERFVRVRVFNGDGPPIPIVRVVLEAPRRELKYPPQPGGETFLYFGNAGSPPPGYDASEARSPGTPEATPEVGQYEMNPDFAGPRGGERISRRTLLLYAAAAMAAAAVLVVVATRIVAFLSAKKKRRRRSRAAV
ncbi:MAG: DUF3999 family protein [Bryobacteraceae bacterium]